MNKILSILAITTGAAMLTGCDDYDDRYIAEYASVVRIDRDDNGEQEVAVWSTDPQETYEVKILRSGHNISQPTSATLRAMTDEEWASYSRTYGVQRYYVLPADCYTLGQDGKSATMQFDSKQVANTTTIALTSENIGKYSATLPPPQYEGEEWANVICLPLILESESSSVLADRKYLLLRVSYMQPSIELSPVAFKKYTYTTSSATTEIEYTLTVPGENRWGFSVKVKNDQAALDSYNQANGTHYQLMKDALELRQGSEWVTWTDQTFELPVGTNTASFKVRIVPSKLGLMDAYALTVAEPTLALELDPAKTVSVIAGAMKPSNTRIKNIAATCPDEDSAHKAANLVDGKSSTYFATVTTERDGDPVYGSYVDFKMPSPMQYFSFGYVGRTSGFNRNNVPDEVDIYVSTDGQNWTLCDHIKGIQNQVPNGTTTVNFGNFDAGQPLQYIRWAVIKGGMSGETDFRAPKTKIYWEATKLDIYAK